jgi:hypothetical protein
MPSNRNPVVNLVRFTPNDEDFLNRKLGSRGEVFYDRDNDTLRIYNGADTAGIKLARNDLIGVSAASMRDALIISRSATVYYTTTIVGPQSPDTGNKYALNGEYRPKPNFVTGYTYIFDQSDDTNVYWPNANGTTQNRHPLNFSSDNLSGVRGGGTAYTSNVVYKLDGEIVTYATYNSVAFDNADTRTVQITVTNATPTTLYYWCYNHLAMGEEIAVADPGSGAGGATVSVGNTLPEDPISGNLWLNTDNGRLYVYIDDGTSTQWMQPSVPMPSLGSISFTGTVIDSVDSSSISFTPAVTFNSDIRIENDLIIAGNIVYGNEKLATESYVSTALEQVVVEALSINASTVGLGNVTNESKATMFTSPTFTGTSTFQQSVEVLNTKTGATGTVDHDYSTGAIWYHTSLADNFTANFTNVPTTASRAISIVLVLIQGATPYVPNVLQIDGTPVTINWLAGLTPSGNASKKDIVSFTFTRIASSWTVFGSLSSFGT